MGILKNRFFILTILAVVLLLIVVLVILSMPLSRYTVDIDNDGTQDMLLIARRFASRYGTDLVIKTSNGKFVYSMKELKPLKVQAADVDGDGKKEISVIVYKKTRLDPEYKIRPFFYNWHPEGLSPKWLGSSLSRPFQDFIFADINNDGAQELIAIEITPDGKNLINVYRWSDFGFAGIGQSQEFNEIVKIKCGGFTEDRGYDIKAKVKRENRWEWISLLYCEDGLVEK